MSHSSKLMTINTMIQHLVSLKSALRSSELSAADYLALNELSYELASLEDLIKGYTLVLEVDEAQQTVLGLSCERKSTGSLPPASALEQNEGFFKMDISDARTLSKSIEWEMVPFWRVS